MNLDEVQEGRTVLYIPFGDKTNTIQIGIIAYAKKPYVYVRFLNSESLVAVSPLCLEYKDEHEPDEIVILNQKLEIVLFKINKFKNRKNKLINRMIIEKLYEDRNNIIKEIIDTKSKLAGGEHEIE